jgi:AcrR family transcriptional regulator
MQAGHGAHREPADPSLAEPAPGDRAPTTGEALLAAAREVFILEGYTRAGVTDIVALAGASVGSLYHHFSGKADLYLALFEQLQQRYDASTRRAVRQCRRAGVSDPLRVLLAGARAYLDVCIDQRDLVAMFGRGDGPPGFGRLWGQRLSDWVARNTQLFARSGVPLDEAAGIVLTGALWLVSLEVARAPDEDHARQLADSALQVLSSMRIGVS